MIQVKRYKHSPVAINIDLIEKVKQSIDATVITLTNKNVYLVEDTLEEVMEKIRKEKQAIQAGALEIIQERLHEDEEGIR